MPEECLYIRYGSFVNYQWFRTTLDQWGGDLRNLITLRGLDYNINARVERQLSLHESPLAPLLGPAVMADVALVGDDPFMREGAARLGCCFKPAAASPRWPTTLEIATSRDISNAKKTPPSKKLQIGGHEVFIHSRRPTNRVRSFYAVDGDFHLMSPPRGGWSSGFTEAGGWRRLELVSAGARFPFRPLAPRKPDAGDQLFVYLSRSVLSGSGLPSPQYQIEMTRRLRSTTDIELFELARWAARNEGKQNPTQQNPTLGDLTSGGILAGWVRPT